MSPRISSFAVLLNATLIGLGLALIAGVIWVGGVGYLKSTMKDESSAPSSETFTGETVYFRRDGSPVIYGTYPSPRGHEVMQYRDLDGKEVVFDEKEILRSCGLFADRGKTHWNVQWRDRVLAFSDQQLTPTFWYFVHDGRKEGRGYFVGYEASADHETAFSSTKEKRVGFIGLSGFRQDSVPEDEQFQISPITWGINNRLHSKQWAAYRGQYPQRYPFTVPGSLLTQIFIIADDGLYQVDLKERTSQRILDLPASEILDVDFLTTSPNDPPKEINEGVPSQVLVRTDKEILFLDPLGTLQSHLPLPESLRAARELILYEPVGDKYYAVATERKWEGQQFHLRCFPYCFDSQGQVLWTKDVELTAPVRHQDHRLEAAYFWAVGAPLSADFAFFVIGPWEGLQNGKTYLESFIASCDDFSQSNLGNPYLLIPLMHLYAFLWAVLAWKRETRYGSSGGQRWMWTLFVYLLGLPALLGYLTHRQWPRLEECPSCKRSVPVDQDSCTQCGSEWPSPARTGIELIEA